MKSWTIKKRVLAGFALVLTLTAIAGTFTWSRMAEIDTNAKTITRDALPSVYWSGALNAAARDGLAIVAAHIIADDSAEMAAIDAQLADQVKVIEKCIGEYSKYCVQPKDHELFDVLKARRKEFAEIRDQKVLPLSRAQKPKEAFAIYKGEMDKAFGAYVAAVQALVDYNKAGGDDAAEDIEKAVSSGRIGVVVGVLASLVAGVGIAWFIARSTNQVLGHVAGLLDVSSDQVAAAAGQVSSASHSLADGASEQAASLEETSASLEEMASMTRRNAENAQQAKEIANQARTTADAGSVEMKRMDTAMMEIKVASDNIAKIIKTIDEIAFQTNILALNAAVEAARAGEAGMGFAVVADEVRNLAQRSAQAAKETAEKIEDCIQKSETGVQISSKVGQSLDEILVKARQVDELVAEIATASREQSQGIDQINTALTQMDKVTQSNAAGAEESASAAEELSGQAQALKEAVGDLKTLVGGATESSVRPISQASSEAPAPKQSRNGSQSKNGSIPHHGVSKSTKPSRANGVHSSNGHKPNGGSLTASAARQSIPLEDEFRDF